MTRARLVLAGLLVIAALATMAVVLGRAAESRALTLRPDTYSVRRFSKVAVLFLENHGYRQIIGSSRAPFLNRIARQGALATRYYAVAHPSLPDYLAMLTGSTGGVTYAERVGDGTGRNHVVGFGELRGDLRRDSLPRFSWITPDLLHDGHNASVRASDRFVSRLVPRVVRALGPGGVLFVGWDEAQGTVGPRGGHIALIATGPGARSHARVSTTADHYSLLATLEAGLRLPPLGHAASPATHLLGGLLARP